MDGSASTQAVLEVSDLGFTYPSGLEALKDLSFTVGKGRAVAVIGPSGCGKSTLLRLISGLMPATSGVVRTHFASGQDASAQVTMVFQDDTLLPWLTVRKNVALYFRFHPNYRTRKEVEERVDELLAMVGLEQFGDAYPNELSGGMRRRVAFLAGIAPDPQLLLLDEPFSSVDEPTRVQIHEQVRGIIERSRLTTILVTHDLAEALSLVGEVLILSARPGRVVARHEVEFDDTDDILELRNTEKFLDLYGRVWRDLSAQIRLAEKGNQAR